MVPIDVPGRNIKEHLNLYGQTRIAFKLAKKYLLLGWYIL
jgi:hypothetical protein